MSKNGFSLLELMVALLIMGVLTSIAIPSYRSHMVRTWLVEAYNSLAMYQLQLEQVYQDAGNYGVNNTCAISMPATKHFTYQCQLSSAGQAYVITATANGVSNLSGYIFAVDQSGTRYTQAFPGSGTSSSAPANCWLSQASGC
jgi:type IV pilus assembly protein PilE